MKVGVHVSISGSIDLAVDRAKEEGCDAFQVFTRNPRGWKFAELDPDEVKSFKEKLAQSKLGPVVDHMPYLPNLSCPEDELYEKSTATLLAEVDRCGTLGIHGGAEEQHGLQLSRCSRDHRWSEKAGTTWRLSRHLPRLCLRDGPSH